MKLKLVFLVIMLGAVLTAVQAQECMTADAVLQERLDAKHDFSFYRIENLRIGMEGAIKYFEKEEKADVSDLENLKKLFLLKAEELQSSGFEDFDSKVNELETYVMMFRDEANELAKDKELLRDAVNESREKEKSYLNGLLKTAYENGITSQLNRFDYSVCRIQRMIDVFSALGHDMSDAQLKLDNYDNYRSDIESKLQDAYDSCKEVPVFMCQTPEREDYDSLADDVKDDFIKTRTFVGLEIAQAVSDRTEKIISVMDKLDIDVSDFEDQLDSIQSDIDDSVDYYLDSKYESAADYLQEFRDDIRSLRQDMREEFVLFKEGLRGGSR